MLAHALTCRGMWTYACCNSGRQIADCIPCCSIGCESHSNASFELCMSGLRSHLKVMPTCHNDALDRATSFRDDMHIPNLPIVCQEALQCSDDATAAASRA